jgi:hypothetical protein
MPYTQPGLAVSVLRAAFYSGMRFSMEMDFRLLRGTGEWSIVKWKVGDRLQAPKIPVGDGQRRTEG